MTKRKLPWTLAAAGTGAVLAVGAVISYSGAHSGAAPIPVAASLSVPPATPTVALGATTDVSWQTLTPKARHSRALRAVEAAFPTAKILSTSADRDGDLDVLLRLHDGRVGTVSVDHHWHVGAFRPRHVTHTEHYAQAPSSTSAAASASSAAASSSWGCSPSATQEAATPAPTPTSSYTPAPTSTYSPSPAVGPDGAVYGTHW